MIRKKYLQLFIILCLCYSCQNRHQPLDSLFKQRVEISIKHLKDNEIVKEYFQDYAGFEKYSYRVGAFNVAPLLELFSDSLSEGFKAKVQEAFVESEDQSMRFFSNDDYSDLVFFFTELPESQVYCQLFLSPNDKFYPIKRDEEHYMGASIACLLIFNEKNEIEKEFVSVVHYN